MNASLIIVIVFLSSMSCNTSGEQPASTRQEIRKEMDRLEPDPDTLPNGNRLFNNLDSAFSLYYKDVVGVDTLKGGYLTCYGIDDSAKYFYLRHGDTLHLLNTTPIYTSTHSLGMIEKDFESFFITAVDNGNTVPHTYQVFDKKTGKNLLGEKVTAWDYQQVGDALYVLYDNHSAEFAGGLITRREADTAFLYNIKTCKRESFALSEENPRDIVFYAIKSLSECSLELTRQNDILEKNVVLNYKRKCSKSD